MTHTPAHRKTLRMEEGPKHQSARHNYRKYKGESTHHYPSVVNQSKH